MRRREQLLKTVDVGLPCLTEMKSMKSLKRGQSVTETGRTDGAGVTIARIVSTPTMRLESPGTKVDIVEVVIDTLSSILST